MSISSRIDWGTRWRTMLGLVCTLMVLAGSGTVSAANESRQTAAGAVSSAKAAPYLVVDMKHHKIIVELAGVTLREYGFIFAGDSVNDGGYADTQTVQSVHLMSAAETISEPELKIIAEETGLAAKQVQRYVPGRMILATSGGLRIYIDTECAGARSFAWEQIQEVFRRLWHEVFGNESLHLTMSADDAMSLYGMARVKPLLTIKQ